jgi:hypothetical protein
MKPVRFVGVAVLVALCICAAPAAGDVPPGFDLFETDPEQTVFSFREEFTIPPNFFDEGSAPFQGDVNFAGDPLGTFQGRGVGDAGLIFHRPGPGVLAPPFPSQSIVQFDVAALRLQNLAPIEVRVGESTQRWDVEAGLSPSRPSQGLFRLVQTGSGGGAFDLAVQVFPQFTFTRLSDGATRTLDAGQSPTPQTSQGLVFRADFVPWRAGCVPPALAVPGLNDGFCPGLADGAAPQMAAAQVKRRAVAQARLGRLGLYPAQPRLEHFTCYAATVPRRFKRREVSLVDQFGSSRARVTGQRGLCVPGRKDGEPFENRRAHLQCYRTRLSPGFASRQVAVRNQFGPELLTVRAPTALCAPSAATAARRRRARPLEPEERIDSFACYRASSASGPLGRRVRLKDRFGRSRVRVLRTVNLCAPAGMGGAAVDHPVEHLVCYEIRELGRGRFRSRALRVTNEFGSRRVSLLAPGLLCVPSAALRR